MILTKDSNDNWSTVAAGAGTWKGTKAAWEAGISGGTIPANTVGLITDDADDTGIIPTGIISPFGGSTAPTGWLICDGTAVSRTTYSRLFAVIGTTFGAGDSSTTFNVPDLRGEFLRGAGTNSHTGQGNGGTVGQHQDATLLPHITSVVSTRLDFYGYSKMATSNIDSGIGSSTELAVLRKDDQDPAGTGNYTNITTRPTNTSVNFIIKA